MFGESLILVAVSGAVSVVANWAGSSILSHFKDTDLLFATAISYTTNQAISVKTDFTCKATVGIINENLQGKSMLQ